MSVLIGPATDSHAADISALILGLSHYFLTGPDGPDSHSFLSTLTPAATAQRLRSDEFFYLVAQHQTAPGQAATVCGVMALRERHHIYHLFVAAPMHRQGIARKLWNHVREGSPAQAFTVNSSISAVSFYERLGFRATAPLQTERGLSFLPMSFSPGR